MLTLRSQWTVIDGADGTYHLQLEGFNAVAEGSLLFAGKEAKMTWDIKLQKNDTEFPMDLYTFV